MLAPPRKNIIINIDSGEEGDSSESGLHIQVPAKGPKQAKAAPKPKRKNAKSTEEKKTSARNRVQKFRARAEGFCIVLVLG